MQVKLVTLSRKTRTSKAGKPYTSLGIKTEEHGDRWLSGFGSSENAAWKAGDSVEIEVEQKGEYLNFSMPKRDRGPAATNGATAEIKNILDFSVIKKLDELLARVQALTDRLDHFIDEDNIQPKFD